MPYRITTVRVNGIRGMNKPEEVAFSEGITLFYGQNGSGKSSLLQAIEWGITGKISYMKGGDFTREDAVVNLFTKSKRGTVELILEDATKKISLQRTRRIARTSSGKQPLEMKIDGKTISSDETEVELEKILKISLEGFSQSKYLHQETLREVLQAKPEEKSQAIDKLLGTYEVRDFVKTLDIDRQIITSITSLQDTIETINREKVQFLLNLRQSLIETKTKLIQQGLNEEELTVAMTLQKLNHSISEINALQTKYNIQLQNFPTIQPNSKSIIEIYRVLQSQLNNLDRARLENINQLTQKISYLRANSSAYKEAKDKLQGINEVNTETINLKIEELKNELNRVTELIKTVRQKLAILPVKSNVYNSLKAKLNVGQTKLIDSQNEYGNTKQIQNTIQKLSEEITIIQNELNKLSGQQRLITIAIESLEQTKAQECPVCSHSIDYTTLVKDLKLKVSEDIQRKSKDLCELENQKKISVRELGDEKEKQEQLKRNLFQLKESLALAAEELSKLVPDFELQTLDDITQSWENEIKETSIKEAQLMQELSSLNILLQNFTQLLSSVNKLEKLLQQETSSQKVGAELSEAAEQIITSLEYNIGEYSDSTTIDAQRNNLSRLADIITFLRDEERSTETEKELPLVEKKIKVLEARISSLQILLAQLNTIKQLAVQYQKEAALTQLKRLEDEINSFYSKIEGHPHFKQLKIDVEKEEPLIFSFKAEGAQGDTYISTRFSTAQFNAAALSIFMSNSSQQAGELPIMIFDDPTQNMDTAHKEAFAKLASTLSPKFQVIIATEDEEVKTFLEKHCKKIMTYYLGEWTLEGPDIKLL
ncbi:SMC family ATPase [Candidatus Bathyarchaeota archaeon]|nr:SMC family ATPase [Candidatus Bathyarchaeota archaeon]